MAVDYLFGMVALFQTIEEANADIRRDENILLISRLSSFGMRVANRLHEELSEEAGALRACVNAAKEEEL